MPRSARPFLSALLVAPLLFVGKATSALATPLFTPQAINRRIDANLAVLQFAGILEQLESQFYAQALQTFTPAQFTDAGFVSSQLVIDQVNVIAADEAAHVSVIDSAIVALGATPEGAKCTFDFAPVLVDVETMVATARVLELVGVGAYLGGATLLTDKNVLTAAGQILTVEARHSSIASTFAGSTFMASPFDVSLSPPAVLALAGGFVTGGCDVVAATGITPLPALEVLSADAVLASGSRLAFKSAGESLADAGLFCQMVVGGAPVALAFPIAGCAVPQDLFGPVYIYVTTDPTPLQTNINQQDASKIKAGPALVFIDPPVPELLAQSLKNIAPVAAAALEASPTGTATQADPAAPSSGNGAEPGTEGSAGSGDTGVKVLHLPE